MIYPTNIPLIRIDSLLPLAMVSCFFLKLVRKPGSCTPRVSIYSGMGLDKINHLVCRIVR